MDVIVHDPGKYHVSHNTVWEFEQILVMDRHVIEVASDDTLLPLVPNILWRLLYRMMKLTRLPRRRPVSEEILSARNDFFVVVMGPNFRKAMPQFIGGGRKSVYLFDAWPRNYSKIKLFAEACRLNHLFVSSSLAAAVLGEALKETKCHWIPEGINPEFYTASLTEQRDIDVLQLGRRYDRYHSLIVDSLEKNGKRYLYEKAVGQIIFPTRGDYIDALARTKISICVPSAHTHPHLAGGIETMTVRYLESMMSRCLVVGHAPSEMIQLFGYDPVIDIDFNQPDAQLRHILDHMEDYQPLIEKNYRAVLDHHTWHRRWEKIARILFPEDESGETLPPGRC